MQKGGCEARFMDSLIKRVLGGKDGWDSGAKVSSEVPVKFPEEFQKCTTKGCFFLSILLEKQNMFSF